MYSTAFLGKGFVKCDASLILRTLLPKGLKFRQKHFRKLKTIKELTCIRARINNFFKLTIRVVLPLLYLVS